jgi:hypothetical protein
MRRVEVETLVQVASLKQLPKCAVLSFMICEVFRFGDSDRIKAGDRRSFIGFLNAASDLRNDNPRKNADDCNHDQKFY